MVQLLSTSHKYNYSFATTLLAYLNKFPNPFAKHVLSCDTLDTSIDEQGRLCITKLVVKTGVLPSFIKPFLGLNVDSYIIERAIIDPRRKEMQTYSANVDHRKVIKVEELLKYTCTDEETHILTQVRFLSNFGGLKNRIEAWSRDKFNAQMGNLRKGLIYVLDKFRAAKWPVMHYDKPAC